MIALLQEYLDLFAWFYEDMSGLDTSIVVHKIPLEKGCKSVKKKLRRAHPDTWDQSQGGARKVMECWLPRSG
jgi:hypothetical protein